MPHHLINDAHEWINKIPTVSIYYLVKPQPREWVMVVNRHYLPKICKNATGYPWIERETRQALKFRAGTWPCMSSVIKVEKLDCVGNSI
ncbi:hypothetical protein AN958_09140 [Leucoagaricus sp. SymC.cos]|nr:hypothetical protein AN958_09140 [Leucoagaricus sp. SymC.cos]